MPGVTLQSQGHLPIPPTILRSVVRGGLTGKLIQPHILCKSQAVSLSVVLWVSWNRNRRGRETKIGGFRSLPKLLDATSLWPALYVTVLPGHTRTALTLPQIRDYFGQLLSELRSTLRSHPCS